MLWNTVHAAETAAKVAPEVEVDATVGLVCNTALLVVPPAAVSCDAALSAAIGISAVATAVVQLSDLYDSIEKAYPSPLAYPYHKNIPAQVAFDHDMIEAQRMMKNDNTVFNKAISVVDCAVASDSESRRQIAATAWEASKSILADVHSIHDKIKDMVAKTTTLYETDERNLRIYQKCEAKGIWPHFGCTWPERLVPKDAHARGAGLLGLMKKWSETLQFFADCVHSVKCTKLNIEWRLKTARTFFSRLFNAFHLFVQYVCLQHPWKIACKEAQPPSCSKLCPGGVEMGAIPRICDGRCSLCKTGFCYSSTSPDWTPSRPCQVCCCPTPEVVLVETPNWRRVSNFSSSKLALPAGTLESPYKSKTLRSTGKPRELASPPGDVAADYSILE